MRRGYRQWVPRSRHLVQHDSAGRTTVRILPMHRTYPSCTGAIGHNMEPLSDTEARLLAQALDELRKGPRAKR